MRYLTCTFILFVFGCLFYSCGPTRFVEPLKRGENAVSAGLGGPMVNVPGIATLPLPFSSITYGRGITENITAYGSWFPTAAVFGVLQLDGGATYGVWQSKNIKHGVSTTAGFNFAVDRFESNARFWPQLDAHYYWKYNARAQQQDDLLIKGGTPRGNLLYAGVGTWYELKGKRAHDQKQQTRIVPMLNIGHDFNTRRWTFKTEIKLIAPFSSNEDIVVDYRSITGRFGATGIYFGITRRF